MKQYNYIFNQWDEKSKEWNAECFHFSKAINIACNKRLPFDEKQGILIKLLDGDLLLF